MNKTQSQEICRQLGNILKQARCNRGLSLEGAEMVTGFRARKIRSMEDGSHRKLACLPLHAIIYLLEQYGCKVVLSVDSQPLGMAINGGAL